VIEDTAYIACDNLTRFAVLVVPESLRGQIIEITGEPFPWGWKVGHSVSFTVLFCQGVQTGRIYKNKLDAYFDMPDYRTLEIAERVERLNGAHVGYVASTGFTAPWNVPDLRGDGFRRIPMASPFEK